ncbi:Fic family protein [Desulfococcus sp.]|uniref:Fic family protein n=1 Tax=Desulfococcus sp. TaxID=2025834 RepID=UPI00359488FF
MPGFLKMMDRDIAEDVVRELRNLWVHGTAGVGGNTLTLGETAFFVEIGMTESSRPLEEYQEIAGHVRAIDMVFDLVRSARPIEEMDLFRLHRALVSAGTDGGEGPAGAWKREPNGTYVHHGDEMTYYEFAAPEDVPCLMGQWISLLNRLWESTHSLSAAASAYATLHMALVLIHPFCDGNGRMARLVSNLPVLGAGFPPILIQRNHRDEYIHLLSAYKMAHGELDDGACLLPENEQLHEFVRFCRSSMHLSMAVVAGALERQKKRRLRKAGGAADAPVRNRFGARV